MPPVTPPVPTPMPDSYNLVTGMNFILKKEMVASFIHITEYCFF